MTINNHETRVYPDSTRFSVCVYTVYYMLNAFVKNVIPSIF